MAEPGSELRLAELAGDEREFERLSRFARREAEAFGLALASYRDPVVARRLRERLRSELEASLRVGELVCTYEDAAVDLAWRLASASEGVDVVFVVGLDRLLLDSGGRPRTTAAIANLNARRDELPERVVARVVLWVSDDGGRSLSEQAWDLVQVVLTTAEFEGTTRVPIPARGFEYELPEWAEPAPADERDSLADQAAQMAGAAELSPTAIWAADIAQHAARLFARAGRLADAGDWLLAAARWQDRSEVRGSAGPLYRDAAALMLAQGDASSALALAERARRRTLAPAEYERVNVRDDIVEDQVLVYGTTCELLAQVFAARGELPAAFRICWELFNLYRRAGYRQAQADLLGELAELHRLRGDLDSALLIRREHQLPLLATLEPSDDRTRAIAKANAGVAELLEQRGELVEALALRREQLAVFERLGPARERGETLARIAAIFEAHGERLEAVRIRKHELPALET